MSNESELVAQTAARVRASYAAELAALREEVARLKGEVDTKTAILDQILRYYSKHPQPHKAGDRVPRLYVLLEELRAAAPAPEGAVGDESCTLCLGLLPGEVCPRCGAAIGTKPPEAEGKAT